MKTNILFLISILIVSMFFITGCQDINNTNCATINIKLDLSKIIKTSRNEASQNSEYILKVSAYEASSYKLENEIEKLPLLAETEKKVDIKGNVKIYLDIEIGLNVIFVAKLYEGGDKNLIYTGNSQVIKIKATDNKVHLNLTKQKTDLDIDIEVKSEIFTVTFNSLGGTTVESQQIEAGSFVEKPTEPTKLGYSFDGWYTSTDGGKTLSTKFDFTTSILSDITLYAKWNAIIFTVTFNTDSGIFTEDTNQNVNYGEKVIEPKDPIRNGYDFLGWYESTDNGITLSELSYSFDTVVTENIELYAKWKVTENFIYIEGTTIEGRITAEGSSSSNVFIDGSSVTIASFYISDHEVTQGEYESYGSYRNYNPTSNYGLGDNYPAYYVSMFDAIVYCNERSIAEGFEPCYSIKNSTNPNEWGSYSESYEDWFNVTCNFEANGYRLPSELEWEYVARGGNLSEYQYKYSGSDNIDDVAWYKANSDSKTHEVKTKQPNTLGLYDMSGNVHEWCFDKDSVVTECYRLRGGGYNSIDNAKHCTVFNNSIYSTPDTLFPYYGFRLVRTAE